MSGDIKQQIVHGLAKALGVPVGPPEESKRGGAVIPTGDDGGEEPQFHGLEDIRRTFFKTSSIVGLESTEWERTQGADVPAMLNDFMQAYENHVWIYRCINILAQSAATVPFRAQHRKKGEEKWRWDDDCALAELIAEPNDDDDTFEFIEGTMISFKATGNAYWEVERVKELPVALYIVRPDRMKITPGTDQRVKKYEYLTRDRTIKTFEPDDIVHIKEFHPTDPLYGLSPIQAALPGLIADFYIYAYTQAFFKNSGRVDAVLETDRLLTKIAWRRIRMMVRKAFIGVTKAHQLAVLEEGLHYKPIQSMPKDTEWKNLRLQNRIDIMAAFGVVPILLGLTEQTPWANAKEQKRVFWENTMLPILARLHYWFNKRIGKPFKDGDTLYRGMFDLSEVAALKEDRQVQMEVLATAVKWRMLTINEAREELGKEEVEWGREPIVPTEEEIRTPFYPSSAKLTDATSQRIADLVREGKFDEEIQKAIETGERPWWTGAPVTISEGGPGPPSDEVILADFQKAVERRTPELERKTSAVLERLLDREARRLAGDINRLVQWTRDGAKPVELGFDHDVWVTDLVRKGGESLLDSIVREEGKLAFQRIGKIAKQVIAASFDVLDPNVLYWIRNKPYRFASDLTGDMLASLSDDLGRTLWDGINAGETTKEMTGRVQSVFEGTVRQLPHRAVNIARTEVGSASNFATAQAMTQSGVVEFKVWISARKSTTRPAHLKAHGQRRPVAEPFQVMGENLQYPLDPAGSAANVCQCLCTMKSELGQPKLVAEPVPEGFGPATAIKEAEATSKKYAKQLRYVEWSGQVAKNIDELNTINSALYRMQQQHGIFTKYGKIPEIRILSGPSVTLGEAGVNGGFISVSGAGCSKVETWSNWFNQRAHGRTLAGRLPNMEVAVRHEVGHWVWVRAERTGVIRTGLPDIVQKEAIAEWGRERIVSQMGRYAMESPHEYVAQAWTIFTDSTFTDEMLPSSTIARFRRIVAKGKVAKEYGIDKAEKQGCRFILAAYCFDCAHLKGMERERLVCQAYPDGIPAEMLDGKFAHLFPHDQRNDLTYESLRDLSSGSTKRKWI